MRLMTLLLKPSRIAPTLKEAVTVDIWNMFIYREHQVIWFHMSNSNSNSDDEGHSSDSISENDGFGNNRSVPRKGRGYNKPRWGKLGKESIEFTKDGLCVVPKDARLVRYLGSLVRNYNLLPLSPMDWRSHDEEKMEKIWKIISDTIDWRAEDIPHIPTIRYTLLKRLSKRARNNRAELKQKYYTPHVGSPSRFICGDDRVDSEQWREMVNYWDNDLKNKIKVEKNIVNRKKLKTSHTGGSMPFIRHIANFKKKFGHEPDPIEAYELVHRRKDKNRSWVDVASEQVATKISRELTQLVDIHGEETSELRLKAYVATMGFETRNRVRCYGDLVTPSMVPWVQQTQPVPSIRKSRKGREYASLESTCLDLKELCEKQSKQIEELKLMVMSSQRQSTNFMSEQSPSRHLSSSEHQSQQSPFQNQSNAPQLSSIQHQPLAQQHSTSQLTGTSQQYMPHPQFGSYQFSSSSGQFFCPSTYHPSFYPQMSYPLGEFTSKLNGTDLTQEVVPPRNNQTDEIWAKSNSMSIEEQIPILQIESPHPVEKLDEVESMHDYLDLTSMQIPSTKEANLGVPSFVVPSNVVTRKRSGRFHGKAKNVNKNCGTIKIKSINETLKNIYEEGMNLESSKQEQPNKRRRGRPPRERAVENMVVEEVVKERYTLRKSARKQRRPTKVRRRMNNRSSLQDLGQGNDEFSAVANKRLCISQIDDAKSNKMESALQIEPETQSSSILPFVKKSPCWAAMESSEVFLSMPQQPHFLPLKKYIEREREGQAILLMVNFSTVVNNILKFSISETDESIDEMMESLHDFERYGFSLYNLQEMLLCFRSLKEDHLRVMDDLNSTNELKSNAQNENDVLNEKIEAIRKSIMELVLMEKTLTDKRSLTQKRLEGYDHEIIRLQNMEKALEKSFQAAKSSLDCSRGIME